MNELPQPRHSPHGFGLLSMADAPYFKGILDMVAKTLGRVAMLELGVANGGTTAGAFNYCQKRGYLFTWVGMDHEIGKPAFPLGDWGTFIQGDLYHPHNWAKVPDDINLLFVDCCHCVSCTVEAFELYDSKVVPGGYVLFHDTCSHPDWQNNPAPHLAQCKPDRFIGTRAALDILKLSIGHHDCTRDGWTYISQQDSGTGQGMYLVQKLRTITISEDV